MKTRIEALESVNITKINNNNFNTNNFFLADLLNTKQQKIKQLS